MSDSTSPTSRPIARSIKATRALVAVLMIGQSGVLHGQGFGYLPLDSTPTGFAISPTGGSRVLVTWIGEGVPDDYVFVTEYRNGFHGEFPPQKIYNTNRKIWSLNLDTNPDDDRFLSLTDGLGTGYTTRVLRYGPEWQMLAQTQWVSNSAYPSKGRMLGPQDRLFLSSHGGSARGRFVDGQSLDHDHWLVIQNAVAGTDDDSDEVNGTTAVTGLDSAMESDGSVTTVFHLGRVRLKRFGADRRLQKLLLLDRPPYSFFNRVGRTAVAVNDSRTTLLAWEWHEYAILGEELARFPSIPAFRAIMGDGTLTDTIRLEPASSSSDHKDRPTAGIRPDGTGAVAWTERETNTSAVWVQRLDADLGAYEAPRRVDGREGYRADQPIIKGDGQGKLYLAWRSTAEDGESARIGILDLAELDQAVAPPRVTHVDGAVRIDWVGRPGSRISLWHSPDLDFGNAEQLFSDEGHPGPASFEHDPGSPSGFYWLSTDS